MVEKGDADPYRYGQVQHNIYWNPGTQYTTPSAGDSTAWTNAGLTIDSLIEDKLALADGKATTSDAIDAKKAEIATKKAEIATEIGTIDAFQLKRCKVMIRRTPSVNVVKSWNYLDYLTP